jgi:spermidine synthase
MTTVWIDEPISPDARLQLAVTREIARMQTPFQSLTAYETVRFGKLFQLDGANMTSEGDEFFYHENLVHPPLIAMPAPRKALIIGGGDGGALEEILKHPSVERVVVAELDAAVIDFARAHFQSIHHGAFDDRRVELHIGDGAAYLARSMEQFDLIALDLTDPEGPAEALYSTAFFEHAKARLYPHGCLALHIGSPVFHPDRVRSLHARLKQTFSLVRVALVYVPIYGALWAMAYASANTDPTALSLENVNARIVARNLEDKGRALQYYNANTHFGMFSLPNFVIRLFEVDSMSTDRVR